MTIDIKYIEELKLFLQLFLLGGILSTVVMYITEAAKKWLKAFKWCQKNTWFITIICFAVSMVFGVGWRLTFAADTISLFEGLWLGLFLYLGSTGIYSKLEESDGFFGKTVQSYYKYVNTDDFVGKIITPKSTDKESETPTDMGEDDEDPDEGEQ